MAKQTVIGGGTSLAVRQFLAVARGEADVHAPQKPWPGKVVSVDQLTRYCMGCYDVRTFDAVTVELRGGVVCRTYWRCRCCGYECEK